MKLQTKKYVFDPIKSDTKTIIKAYKKPLWLISILMGILIFILNVFFGTALYGNSFNSQLKDKLGVYIYLSDVNSTEEQIVKMKEELEKKGLRIDYTSKQDALSFVEKRVPDLTDTLKKYKLENPLPSTLYIRYNNQLEFDDMKNILEKNKNMIMNMSDISDNTIKTQENRILNIINLSNFLQNFAYLVVLALLITIVTFSIFFLKTIFAHFSNDIQAKKLLGASASQVIQPFLNVISRALWLAFFIAIIGLLLTLIPLDKYLSLVLGIDIINYLSGISLEILAIAIIEIGTIMLLLRGISYHYVWRLHKKLK